VTGSAVEASGDVLINGDITICSLRIYTTQRDLNCTSSDCKAIKEPMQLRVICQTAGARVSR